MPNNKYLRSVRREREIVNYHRAQGCVAARSAGSKSPVDVWVFSPKDNELTMIQVKTKIGGRGLVIEDRKTYSNVFARERWYFYA